MHFKNLKIYQITGPIDLNEQFLNQSLQQNSFSPCSQLQMSSLGWISPLAQLKSHQSETEPALAYINNQKILLCLKEQQKLLPASVVNELLQEKLELIEDRKVSNKEKKQIKEDLILELLPQAFSRSYYYYAYIDPQLNLLIINSASQNKSEQFSELLRKSIGTLPIIPFKPEQSIINTLTAWLKGESPSNWQLGQSCELVDPADEKGKIRCSKIELNSDDIINHLDNGKLVSKLTVIWEDKIEFNLDEAFSIKGIKFTDSLLDNLDDENEHEDPLIRFDTDFHLMTQLYSDLIQALSLEFMQQPAEKPNRLPRE